MGMFGFTISSSDDKIYSESGQPDPYKFEILQISCVGNWSAVKIRYPNCTNYEGNKILLCNQVESLIRKHKRIDPHFTDKENALNLFARFEPTEKGWEEAVALARLLSLIDKRS